LQVERRLDGATLWSVYQHAPGLASDKLKQMILTAWSALANVSDAKGLVLAYDEAQTISDQPKKEEYPLAMLLDVFQSIQRQGVPIMLVLTGLPTLFPKLVEARTFAERMFNVVTLKSLSETECRDAIQKPIEAVDCPVKLSETSVETVVQMSGGYPYFIQFICREVYDAALQKLDAGEPLQVPMDAIIRKLDADFFAGRWARATDRQRDLLRSVASLPNADREFTVQEVVEAASGLLDKPFTSSHVNQMFTTLCKVGLIYKNRYGKYSFAVPLFGQFILRQDEHRRHD
jgi:hypothetical protein